jgi:nicotinamide-nucleotide amidase
VSPFPAPILALSAELLSLCRKEKWRLVTAESCTGGLIAACLTEHGGSSDVVDRGFVTYANEAKVQMLGVLGTTLEAHGAVSEEVAREMAEGARLRSACDLAIAVTGIAGPGGATPSKPVGLVHIAAAGPGSTRHERHLFTGDRSTVRLATVEAALRLALQLGR